MSKRPGEVSLIIAAILLIIASGLAALAAYLWDKAHWAVILFLAASALALLAAAAGLIASGIDQLMAAHRFDWALVAARRAAAATPEAVILRERAELVQRLNMSNPVVLQILANDKELAKMIAGSYGPAAAVMTKFGAVPYDFVDEWYTVNARSETLRPVRDWPTAGNRQKYASMFERHLIVGGLLVTWDGSKTAEWASAHAREEFIRQYYGQRVNRLRTVEAEG